MGFLELFIIAVGLSMDAFAVALCRGVKMQRPNISHALIIAIFFSVFQAGMPLIGWLLGKQFANLITAFDHWLAFGLLLLIGGKMIHESFKKDDRSKTTGNALNIRELFVLAIATSIDALAVGITFAFIQTDILTPITLIGIVTFCLSLLGVAIGYRFGTRYKSKAELAGGVVLILIGTKILLEHLVII